MIYRHRNEANLAAKITVISLQLQRYFRYLFVEGVEPQVKFALKSVSVSLLHSKHKTVSVKYLNLIHCRDPT